MTSDGTHSYAWDARNRLSAIDSGTTASFTYDPFGRRGSKTIGGTQTGFLYDGGWIWGLVLAVPTAVATAMVVVQM